MVGSTSILLPGTRTQLSEEEDCIAVVVCSAGDLHGHLEPRQKEGTTSRLVWQTSDRKNCRPKKKKIYIFLYSANMFFTFTLYYFGFEFK